jgi:hypothetical protein
MLGRLRRAGKALLGDKAASVDKAVSNEKVLLFEVDEPFTSRYNNGIDLTGTPGSAPNRRSRFYNLVNLLRQTQRIEGSVAECGCWKGLSSYLMCNELRDADSGFRGQNYFIFDSFEGLSLPSAEDVIRRSIKLKARDRIGGPMKSVGAYSASEESVREVLFEFPEITMVKGWLPQSLECQPERTYRFAHLDLDLYEPTKGSARYFLKRMAKGGIVVCDDYGSLLWPGAKQAFDEIAAEFGLNVVSLSSGQGIMLMR